MQYYHVGLPYQIWLLPQLHAVYIDGMQSRQYLAFDGLMLLPGLWHRCNCLFEKQSAVETLATGIQVSKSCHTYTTKH